MGAARVFFKWTPGESSGSAHKTRHVDPSPWQCYSLYWQMRHELKSSEEGEGGEGRGKGRSAGKQLKAYLFIFFTKYRKIFGAARVFF